MSMEGGGATFSAGIALATEVFQEAFKETRYVAQGNGQQRGADCREWLSCCGPPSDSRGWPRDLGA